MLDFDQEINVAAFSDLHPKPLVYVDGELVRGRYRHNISTSVLQTKIQPEHRDEQADAGRDCRNRLRLNGDRENVQLTTSRIS